MPEPLPPNGMHTRAEEVAGALWVAASARAFPQPSYGHVCRLSEWMSMCRVSFAFSPNPCGGEES